MNHQIEELKIQAQQDLSAANDEKQLEEVRVKYLGRKSRLTDILRGLKDLPPSERADTGQQANKLKTWLEAEITSRREKLKQQQWQARIPSLDVTLPGRRPVIAKKHPLTQITEQICNIFLNLGFQIAEGPEVESDYYNFEALNIPPDHPARDMHDTFYFTEKLLLRTHTSPVQVRVMEKMQPPVRIIVPGKVYRRDYDITHSPMFHQVEGLLVDEQTTFSNLKGVLEIFVRRMFGENARLRFRPSFFPFTEPSAEVDIGCVICGGKGTGCRVCKGTGWLEILGSGMVHPAVLENVGYDSERYTGFAFGMGVERIAMLKYGIDDIRLFYENDIRFLAQF